MKRLEMLLQRRLSFVAAPFPRYRSSGEAALPSAAPVISMQTRRTRRSDRLQCSNIERYAHLAPEQIEKDADAIFVV